MIPTPKIIFVCTANVCRSPFAEAVAKKYIEESKDKSFVDIALTIESSGVIADVDSSLCPRVSEMVDVTFVHQVKEFNLHSVDAKTLIFVMEEHQQARLVSLFPKLRSQIFLARTAAEIAEKLANGLLEGTLYGSEDAVESGFSSPHLPTNLKHRWDWIMLEFDANRGLLPNLGVESESNRLEIPDAHSSEKDIHDKILDLVGHTVGNIMKSLEIVLSTELVEPVENERETGT